MAGIFISYRRKEGQAHARLIFQHLRRSPRFWGRVFMDVDGLKPGENFRDKIGKQLDGCTVLLALIGVQWALLRDEHGAVRLRDEQDWVRLEIETALKRGITVIPVLIDGAQMPSAADLPLGLNPLRDRHAFTLDLAQRFDPGMQELDAAIRPFMPFPAWTQAVLVGTVLTGAVASWQMSRLPPISATPAPQAVVAPIPVTPRAIASKS